MHQVLTYLATIILFTGIFTGCRKDPQNPTLTAEEYPRILGNWTKEANVYEGDTVNYNIQFSPAALCRASWKIDGVEVWTGPNYRFPCPLVTGKDTLRIRLEVTNGDQVNSRDGIIILNP